MPEVVFESQLLKDGHLYCPAKYAVPKAKYKVIVSLPEKDAAESEIELAAVTDLSEDFLSEEEVEYYMNMENE